MTPDLPRALPPALSAEPLDQSASDATPAPTTVEDTAAADVGDNAANEAADALIDAAELDPVRPGEPRDSHRTNAAVPPPASAGPSPS